MQSDLRAVLRIFLETVPPEALCNDLTVLHPFSQSLCLMLFRMQAVNLYIKHKSYTHTYHEHILIYKIDMVYASYTQGFSYFYNVYSKLIR